MESQKNAEFVIEIEINREGTLNNKMIKFMGIV